MNPNLVNQPSLAPTRKVAAMGLTAAGVSVILGIAHYGFGVDLDPEFATGIVTLLAAGAGYMTRERAA